MPDSKNTFPPNSINWNDFFKNIWIFTVFSLPVDKTWAYMVGYYCLNSDFRCTLACYSPNHTSKQPSWTFIWLKVVYTKDIFILSMAKVFEICFFLQYKSMWKYLKRSKMWPKHLNTLKHLIFEYKKIPKWSQKLNWC